MKKERKRKFVVWLHNFTDRRDDEWKVVWATDIKEVEKVEIEYDKHRFRKGQVMDARTFRRYMGISA